MTYKIEDQFNLQQQFENYCAIGYGKTPDQLSAAQHTEIKRAFFFAWGQSMLVSRDYVGAIEDELQCVYVLENMLEQVTDFMLKEQNRNQ